MTRYVEVTAVTFRDALRLSTLDSPTFREDLSRGYDRYRSPCRRIPKPGWRERARDCSPAWHRRCCALWADDTWQRPTPRSIPRMKSVSAAGNAYRGNGLVARGGENRSLYPVAFRERAVARSRLFRVRALARREDVPRVGEEVLLLGRRIEVLSVRVGMSPGSPAWVYATILGLVLEGQAEKKVAL